MSSAALQERFAMAAGITGAARDAAAADRAAISAHVDALLGADGVLLVPTVPGPAPLRGLPSAELEAWRASMLQLTCVASIAGLPQATLPVASVDGLPVGLSLIGTRGSDEALLALAGRMADAAAGAEAA
eukprot:359472-Chlamydomonas_euryale.AAC.1